MTVTYEEIRYEVDTGVATITINRPDQLNPRFVTHWHSPRPMQMSWGPYLPAKAAVFVQALI